MIFPKKEILYAPMLGTLGGGSMRSFGRGTGGGGSPVFGYAVGRPGNGVNSLLKFDPDTMTVDSYHNDNAGSSLQNVAIDNANVFANHGYSNNAIDNWKDKTDLANGGKYSYSSHGQPSRSAIAVDANYLYFADNSGYLRRMQKGNGLIANSLYYTNGELYGVAIDPQYVFVGGGVNSGNIRTYQRATMGTVGNTNTSGYLNTLLSICSDNDYVYISGVWLAHNNQDHFIRCNKMSNGTGLFNVQYYSSTTTGYGSTTTAICVDNTYVYTCSYGTNRITQWYKTNGQEAASLATNYTSAKYGSVTTTDNKGMTHDEDYLYIASETNQGATIIKVQKSNMTVVDDLVHQHASDFGFYSGGRHIALDNQIGGPAFYTDSAVTNYNVTDNTSLLLS